MFGIIWVRVRSESTFENYRWCISIHLFVVTTCAVCILCANIADKGVQSRMNKLSIILAHNLSLDNSRVFLLLRK